jgi:hypothetical protein
MGRHTGTITKKLTGIDATASDTPAPTMPSLSPRTTTSTRWRRILPAALCAAALGAALTVPAIASAEPREWDIGQFKECMQGAGDDPNEDYDAVYVRCCAESGGQISEEQNACVAPPCDCDEPAQVRPGVIPPGGLPTLTAVPATPTPRPVAPTLAPAPAIGG